MGNSQSNSTNNILNTPTIDLLDDQDRVCLTLTKNGNHYAVPESEYNTERTHLKCKGQKSYGLVFESPDGKLSMLVKNTNAKPHGVYESLVSKLDVEFYVIGKNSMQRHFWHIRPE